MDSTTLYRSLFCSDEAAVNEQLYARNLICFERIKQAGAKVVGILPVISENGEHIGDHFLCEIPGRNPQGDFTVISSSDAQPEFSRYGETVESKMPVYVICYLQKRRDSIYRSARVLIESAQNV